MARAGYVYHRYQDLYEHLGTGPLFVDTPFLQGAFRYVPAPTDEGLHHLLGGCDQVAADAETVEVSAEDVEWDRICDDCALYYETPDYGLTTQVLKEVSTLVEAVKAAGGTVENEETPFTAVENILKSEKFPLSSTEEPDTGASFWLQVVELGYAVGLLTSDTDDDEGAAEEFWRSWAGKVRDLHQDADRRWSEDKFGAKSKDYLYTRNRLISELGDRVWEQELRAETSRSHSSDLAWPDLQLADSALTGVGLDVSHIADLQLTDYPDVGSYIDAVNERLVQVAREALDVPESEKGQRRYVGFRGFGPAGGCHGHW